MYIAYKIIKYAENMVLIWKMLNHNGSACLIVAMNIWQNCTRKTNVLYKNIMEFLLFQRDIALYLKTKCCVKFCTEKDANKYFKLADMAI